LRTVPIGTALCLEPIHSTLTPNLSTLNPHPHPLNSPTRRRPLTVNRRKKRNPKPTTGSGGVPKGVGDTRTRAVPRPHPFLWPPRFPLRKVSFENSVSGLRGPDFRFRFGMGDSGAGVRVLFREERFRFRLQGAWAILTPPAFAPREARFLPHSSASVYLVSPACFAWGLFCARLDGVVPQTRLVNLRIFGRPE